MAKDVVAAAVYRLVQVLTFPQALLGYIAFALRLFQYSRSTGVSSTALSGHYVRYMLHMLGTRRDEAARKLMAAMPNVSQTGLRLVTGGSLLGHRLTGYVPEIYRYPYAGSFRMAREPVARTTYMDAAVEEHLGDIEQLVVLGAGWDTRLYRLPEGTPVRRFEVDAPATQAFKLRILAEAGVDTTGVQFLPVDLEQRDLMEALASQGFDPGKRTLFLWEAVSMYLDRESVERVLRGVAGCAPGSAVVFDFFTADMLTTRSAYMRYARATLKYVGEPMHFGIEGPPPVRDRLAEFLDSCGLRLQHHRLLRRGKDRPVEGGLALAVVPGRAQG